MNEGHTHRVQPRARHTHICPSVSPPPRCTCLRSRSKRHAHIVEASGCQCPQAEKNVHKNTCTCRYLFLKAC